MFVLVLAAEADETRQAVMLLIVCLVGIAVMLAVLTVWFWLFTSPKRRADRLLTDLGHYVPAQPDTESAQPDPVATAVVANEREADLVGAASPKILIDSSNLMSSTLADSNEPFEPAAQTGPMPTSVETNSSNGDRSSERLAATSEVSKPTRPTVHPKRSQPPGRPDLRVSAAPKTVRRSDAKPSEAPRKVRSVTRVDPAVARPAAEAVPRQAKPESKAPAETPTGRIEVAARPSVGPSATAKRSDEDELAKARQRKARQKRDQAGLSDDDWSAVMKSAFNHLNR